ncbi:AtpZ/AtpI family protein [Humisphaera borealis]|uniref:AtpZ/AtpI family protein n=1 Tax=Humisphaera borealis TaxID=2807512 RepID=A0A7M2WUE8_9BACT|nr:AtpZ/AtpI family protein [Humisphaera borealis]QOV89147.1 AtpZ/AtpI family protein [Humisphaera borealis]
MAESPRPPESEKKDAGAHADDLLKATPDPHRESQQSSEELATWHRLAGVGIEFIVAFGLFAWLGWWLDKKFATGPWLLIAGCALGFTSGLWSLIKAARKMM